MLNGRIIKGVGGLYFVDTEQGIYECQARGLFRKQGKSPCVGDFVDISIVDKEKLIGYLHDIHERKNELFRPRIVNIDVALMVFSISKPALNLSLLDKFLIFVEKQGLDIIICLNKSDLVSEEEIAEIVEEYTKIGYQTVSCSAYSNSGIDELTTLLSGKVCVLAGPSGVGKSSIANAVLMESVMETGVLSAKIDRGKHTTRHAEFFRLKNGGFLADTPGFASITTENIEPNEFKFLFREFGDYLGKCRFKNCNHDAEPDCAVKQAVGSRITKRRYESYISYLRGNAKYD